MVRHPLRSFDPIRRGCRLGIHLIHPFFLSRLLWLSTAPGGHQAISASQSLDRLLLQPVFRSSRLIEMQDFFRIPGSRETCAIGLPASASLRAAFPT